MVPESSKFAGALASLLFSRGGGVGPPRARHPDEAAWRDAFLSQRHLAVGKQTVETPWSGACLEFHEWEGFPGASRIEVSWELPEGSYAYYHCEIISCEVIS
jgi:Family of unknown function (DUF6920)